jgi:hypothetical protein
MKALKSDKKLNVVSEFNQEDSGKEYDVAHIEENDMFQEQTILKQIDRVSVEFPKANYSLLNLSAN